MASGSEERGRKSYEEDAGRTEADYKQEIREMEESHRKEIYDLKAQHTRALAEADRKLEDAQRIATTMSTLNSRHIFILHNASNDGKTLVDELSKGLEVTTQCTGLADMLASQQLQSLSPGFFPADRRLDSINTDIEEGFALVADVSGALILFASVWGTYIFRPTDVEHVLLNDNEISLVFNQDLMGLPEKLRTIQLNSRKLKQKRWDAVWIWRRAYLPGVVNKMVSGYAESL